MEGIRSQLWDGPALIGSAGLKPHAMGWGRLTWPGHSWGRNRTLLFYLYELEAVVAVGTLERSEPLLLVIAGCLVLQKGMAKPPKT